MKKLAFALGLGHFAALAAAAADPGLPWQTNFADATVPGTMQKILFPRAGPARCLDGSPAGFYFSEPWSSDAVNPRTQARSRSRMTMPPVAGLSATEPVRVIVYLQGGGLCVDDATCTARAKTDLGSSDKWPATMTQGGILSDDCDENPRFCHAGKIFVPYCSGDVYSGTRTNATAETFGLYFAGHLNVVAVFDELASALGRAYGGGESNGVEVVLSGGSAGGIGALTHANWLDDWRAAVQQRRLPGNPLRIASVPNAGFFIDAKPFVDPFGFLCDRIAGPVSVIFASWFDPTCAAANGANAHRCVCGPEMLAAVQTEARTPLFLAETQFDSNQIFVEDGAPRNNGSAPVHAYLAYFGSLMRSGLAPAMADGGSYTPRTGAPGLVLPLIGAFVPSCLTHVLSWTGIEVPRNASTAVTQTYRDTLYCWYFGPDGGPGAPEGCLPRLLDNCGLEPCSPASPDCARLA
jgi:hypothetical protein